MFTIFVHLTSAYKVNNWALIVLSDCTTWVVGLFSDFLLDPLSDTCCSRHHDCIPEDSVCIIVSLPRCTKYPVVPTPTNVRSHSFVRGPVLDQLLLVCGSDTCRRADA